MKYINPDAVPHMRAIMEILNYCFPEFLKAEEVDLMLKRYCDNPHGTISDYIRGRVLVTGRRYDI